MKGINKKYIMNMTKILLIAYIITILLIVLLAAAMNAFDLEGNWIHIGTIGTLILSTFVGGFIGGKAFKEKKWFHGLIIGLLYFFILVILSLGIVKGGQFSSNFTTSFIICICSSTLGAMLG